MGFACFLLTALCGKFVKASCLFFCHNIHSFFRNPIRVFYILISIQKLNCSFKWVSNGYSVGGPGDGYSVTSGESSSFCRIQQLLVCSVSRLSPIFSNLLIEGMDTGVPPFCYAEVVVIFLPYQPSGTVKETCCMLHGG